MNINRANYRVMLVRDINDFQPGGVICLKRNEEEDENNYITEQHPEHTEGESYNLPIKT